MISYEKINNLYCSILQREIDSSGFNSYQDIPIGQVKDILLASEEYKKLNARKSSKKSQPISIPYTIISVDDRACENIKRTQFIVDGKFINDIQFVDGRKTNMETYFSNLNIKITWDERAWNRKPFDGELGCTASQVNCLKYIVDNDIPELIVFEDDAILIDNFMDILSNCRNDLPKDYDFLTNTEEIWIGHLFDKSYDQLLIDSEFVYKSYLSDGCSKFMMYSNSGARKMLEAYQKFGVYCPVDWFMFNLSRDKILNGYSTFAGNTLIQPKNQFGSLIDPGNIRGQFVVYSNTIKRKKLR